MADDLVFISYAGPDHAHAEALARALQRHHLPTFVDTLALSPGDPWDTGITDAIERARMFVVLLSAAWRRGDRWYAHDEVARAIDAARAPESAVRIVPAIIDGVSPRHMPSGLARLIPLPDAARDWSATAARLAKLYRGERTGHQPGDRHDRGARLSIGRLPGGGRFFLGRGDALATLDTAWEDADVQLQAVIGAGGEGKTALVDRWLARMKRSDYGGAARVYGWSFYSQGAGEDRQVSADLFFEQALTWFGATGPRELDPWARGEQLAALIRQQPTLLVLDGLEPLQFPPGESEGRIKDPALRALLTELAAEMSGLCLVTSRLPLRDFAEETPGIGALRLPPLTAEVGAEVLRRWGVRGDEGELRAAVGDVKGHALAVGLMGS
ncbi:MAG: TIR domain-containing protein [Myxococcales bacterium]|nr:TIR domain-containing protein [Myxococcales bacterium]